MGNWARAGRVRPQERLLSLPIVYLRFSVQQRIPPSEKFTFFGVYLILLQGRDLLTSSNTTVTIIMASIISMQAIKTNQALYVSPM
jgi:hypothetical protein